MQPRPISPEKTARAKAENDGRLKMTVSRWFLFELALPQDWPPHASAWCVVLLHVGCVECFEFTREPTDDAGHG